MSTSTFTRFPRLSLELQQMIWKTAAASQPRMVFVDIVENKSVDNHFIYSKAPIPAMLHACFESRRMAGQVGYVHTSRKPGNKIGGFWLHPNIDTLCISQSLKQYGSRYFAVLARHLGGAKPKKLGVLGNSGNSRHIFEVGDGASYLELQEFSIIIAHSGSKKQFNYSSKEPERAHDLASDPWIFEDLNKSEINDDLGRYVGGSSILNVQDRLRDERGPGMSNIDLAAKLDYHLRAYQKDLGEANSKFASTPELRFGMVMSLSQLKKRRDEYWSKFSGSKGDEWE